MCADINVSIAFYEGKQFQIAAVGFQAGCSCLPTQHRQSLKVKINIH